MSEFFLELFSEEMPTNLQSSARENLLINFKTFFEKENIEYKNDVKVISTPNRLVIYFKNVNKEIIQKSEEIRGPSTNAPEKAIFGFIKSNNIEKKNIYKKTTEKGEFFFYKKPSKKIKTIELLNKQIPIILNKLSWKKSMKWGEHDLYWGRPLKSLFGVFDGQSLKFKFHHLVSCNGTFIDNEFEEKIKNFKNFSSYFSYFKKLNVIIDNDLRKNYIEQKLLKLAKSKNLIININTKLLNEVSNIVDKPKIILCNFNKKYLDIPKEIIIITMQQHQKYFPTYDNKENLTNNFFIVANSEDLKGLIKIGNERVVEARLSDAEFFWKKDKSQNMVKRVTNLKSMNYFKGLGTYFDKSQRLRKLGGIISDELLISKEKVELSASICKVDLLSEIVGEFPELQGVMGGYFATAQGFDKDLALAISEQYLPIGSGSRVPKKPFSIALSIADKIDTLVGFFGLEQKPTSSKDPFALRRLALGIIRIIIKNKKDFKIRDLINYSSSLYLDQGFEFENKFLQKELSDFLMERLKYFMKEENIRSDIIQAATSSFNIDQSVIIFNKAKNLNKIISKQNGIDIISSYKRASNILDSEMKNHKNELSNITDPGIFKTELEKNLFKKINELRKYFSNLNKDENYEQTLDNLAGFKREVFEFFDNVIVNEDDPAIKKNRLELIQMMCKTFNNYINFSLIDTHQ